MPETFSVDLATIDWSINVRIMGEASLASMTKSASVSFLTSDDSKAGRDRSLAMWAVEELSNFLIRRLLAADEGQFVDFKDKASVAKCTKTISAFANADGGELFIGIRDKKEDNRLENLFVNEEEANGCVGEIFAQFALGPEYINLTFLKIRDKGLCLHCTVQKTPFVVHSSDGRVYKRQNASDKEIKTPSERHKLELEKGVRSFEDSSVELVVSDLSPAESTEAFLKSVVPSSTLDDFLRKERLTSDQRLRACALILFDENPQSLLPQAAAKVYRYRTLANEGDRSDLESQPHTIEGPAYEVIFKTVEYTKEKIENIPLLGEGGLIKVNYPADAIHEVICNAVVHRDYSINDYVHVRIFDNRVEVESPGKLAGPVTVNNILKQRFARNKKIVRLLAKFPTPPNKDVGEGLNTTFRAMQQLNLGRPDIEETEASVIVRLKHEPLASKEDLIKNHVTRYGEINNTRAREICNVQSDSIIRKLFHSMISAGELEKVPNTRGKGTRYRLPESKKA